MWRQISRRGGSLAWPISVVVVLAAFFLSGCAPLGEEPSRAVHLSAPNDVQVTALDRGVVVTWEPVRPGAVYYVIYRKRGVEFENTPAGVVNATGCFDGQCRFEDMAVSGGANVSYLVRAVDGSGRTSSGSKWVSKGMETVPNT